MYPPCFITVLAPWRTMNFSECKRHFDDVMTIAWTPSSKYPRRTTGSLDDPNLPGNQINAKNTTEYDNATALVFYVLRLCTKGAARSVLLTFLQRKPVLMWAWLYSRANMTKTGLSLFDVVRTQEDLSATMTGVNSARDRSRSSPSVFVKSSMVCSQGRSSCECFS